MAKNRYRICDPRAPHFVTCAVVLWTPLFIEPPIVAILLRSIRHLQANKQLRLHGYMVMENHLHLIASGENLSAALARFKSFTAQQIIKWLQENGRKTWLKTMAFANRKKDGSRTFQVWQEGYHPQIILGEEMMRQKLNYIHANPVRRGYVDEPTHWRISSARNYNGMPGALEIEMLT